MATYTDGYGGDVFTGQDTSLYSGDTDRSYGAATGLGGSAAFPILARFNLSAIPAGSTCISATLYFYQILSGGAANAIDVNVYSVAAANKDWIEGGSANPETSGGPTWDYRAQTNTGAGTAWAGSAGCATSGTDYESTLLGAFLTAGAAKPSRSDANGTEYHAALSTSRIAGWFGATNTNYGLYITQSGTVGGFGSAEHATTGYRPKLVVEYTAASSSVVIPVLLESLGDY